MKRAPAGLKGDELGSRHPAVRTHPETGRKALYVNLAHTTHFEGMTEEESAPILEFLFRHQVKAEFTCRFRWEKGSVAFWRSEEHTSELQSLMRISYAVFCLQKKNLQRTIVHDHHHSTHILPATTYD